jgi:hypothetical protein
VPAAQTGDPVNVCGHRASPASPPLLPLHPAGLAFPLVAVPCPWRSCVPLVGRALSLPALPCACRPCVALAGLVFRLPALLPLLVLPSIPCYPVFLPPLPLVSLVVPCFSAPTVPPHPCFPSPAFHPSAPLLPPFRFCLIPCLTNPCLPFPSPCLHAFPSASPPPSRRVPRLAVLLLPSPLLSHLLWFRVVAGSATGLGRSVPHLATVWQRGCVGRARHGNGGLRPLGERGHLEWLIPADIGSTPPLVSPPSWRIFLLVNTFE